MLYSPHVFPISPRPYMLDFNLALIASFLYSNITNPERKEVPTELSEKIRSGSINFPQLIEQQKLLWGEWIDKESVPIYSKATRRPISKDLALQNLANDDTADFHIYDHDLLFGDRYSTSYLYDVIGNAKQIISLHPCFFSTPPSTEQDRSITASSQDDDPDEIWKTKARMLADLIALKRFNSGIREITARNICDAVATELATDSTTHGNRGPRSAGGIRTHALKGWKFAPPAGTNGTSGSNE